MFIRNCWDVAAWPHEAQQSRQVPGRRQVGILIDAGAAHARRVMAERLATETTGTMPAEKMVEIHASR